MVVAWILFASLLLVPSTWLTPDGQRSTSGVPALGGSSSGFDSASLLQQARALLAANQLSNAETCVRHALQLEQTSADGHFLLGYLLFREIQEQDVMAVTSSADQAWSTSTIERDVKARASLHEYTAGATYRVPSAFDLKIVAVDYILLDDYPDAEKWLEKSLSWVPNDVQARYYLGRVEYKEAKYQRAVELFRQVLSVNEQTIEPQKVEAEDNLGLAYEQLGQITEAISAFNLAISWAEVTHAANDGPWIDLGSLLIEQQHAEAALPYLVRAAELTPSDVRVHERAAAAYRQLGLWHQVQSELEQAVVLAPKAASLHFLLGQAYQKNGSPEKASPQFKEAAALHAEAVASEVGAHH